MQQNLLYLVTPILNCGHPARCPQGANTQRVVMGPQVAMVLSLAV
jgi:hypothetical protein